MRAAAGTAPDAAQAALTTKPDVVILDYAMPVQNGVEATRAIRDRCPDSHVVMLTGRREREDEVGSGEAGAVGFLHKDQLGSPRLADELLALVALS